MRTVLGGKSSVLTLSVGLHKPLRYQWFCLLFFIDRISSLLPQVKKCVNVEVRVKSDQQADWCGIHQFVVRTAELWGKALNLAVSLGSSCHLWLWDLGSEQETKTLQGRGEQLAYEGRARSRTAALLQWKRPGEVVRESYQDTFPYVLWKYSGHVQLDILEQTQKNMEGLHLPYGLRMPRDSLWGAGGHRWGKSCVVYWLNVYHHNTTLLR